MTNHTPQQRVGNFDRTSMAISQKSTLHCPCNTGASSWYKMYLITNVGNEYSHQIFAMEKKDSNMIHVGLFWQ